MRWGRCILLLVAWAMAFPVFAQEASAPHESVVQGIPPDERVDITGDGIADLVITGRTELIPDPEQGLDGWYRRVIRPLAGSSILMRSTPNDRGYYALGADMLLDTAALAQGFHFKQLQWSAPDAEHEFRILQQPFGPGITPEMKGWYGMGEYYDGSMVLRSTMGGRTTIAAFTIRFNLPAGRIWVTAVERMSVPSDFGKAGDPSPVPPVEHDPFSFGHEREPQTIIPPGIPPDEPIFLDSDEVPDVIITGHEEHGHCTGRCGYYVRSIAPAPGTAFLKQRSADGTWMFFHLGESEQLTPEALASGLQRGELQWADPDREHVFIEVLRHPFGMADVPNEWSRTEQVSSGALVYRMVSYGVRIIGALEISCTLPGGEISIHGQLWVEEGGVLEIR